MWQEEGYVWDWKWENISSARGRETDSPLHPLVAASKLRWPCYLLLLSLLELDGFTIFFKSIQFLKKIIGIFITDGKKLVDPRNCQLVTSYKSALQSGEVGVGGVLRSLVCGTVEEDSVISRYACRSVEGNPDPAHVIAFHWDGRFGKCDRHAECEFQGYVFGHMRDPFEARWRVRGWPFGQLGGKQ